MYYAQCFVGGVPAVVADMDVNVAQHREYEVVSELDGLYNVELTDEEEAKLDEDEYIEIQLGKVMIVVEMP